MNPLGHWPKGALRPARPTDVLNSTGTFGYGTRRATSSEIAEAGEDLNQRSGPGHGMKNPDVPIQIHDTRDHFIYAVDEIIARLPNLNTLDHFEPGSRPDYIDRICLTRAEAFARYFPHKVHEIQGVPGSEALPQVLRQRHRRNQECKGERVQELEDALYLECKRADILGFAVQELRADLLRAQKRLLVLSAMVECADAADIGFREAVLELPGSLGVVEVLQNVEGLPADLVIQRMDEVSDGQGRRDDIRGRSKRSGFAAVD